jgi:hypothetical protein
MNAAPFIGVLGLPLNNLETLKDVDNVVNAPSLNRQLLRAAVEVQQVMALFAIKHEEAFAELAEAFLLATVLPL